MEKNNAKDNNDLQAKTALLRSITPLMGQESSLIKIAQNAAWKRYLPGNVVIRQGDEGREFFLIERGLLKVYLEDDNKQIIVSFLSEGDCFGEMSLLTNMPTSATVETVEETVCLVSDKEDFVVAVRRLPGLSAYFNSLLTERMKTVYQQLLTTTPGMAQVEPYLYRKRVRDILSPAQTPCHKGTAIRVVARDLIEKNETGCIVTGDDDRTLGIVCLRDIVKHVVGEGINAEEPIGKIARSDYKSVDADDYFFDALHIMIHHGEENGLAVLDKGVARGFLAGKDLLRFRGREVLSIRKNIDEARGLEELDRMRREVEQVLRALVADNTPSSNVCKIVSELNDKIVRRVLGIIAGECGVPPVPYAWLGLGSEGRKEQTLLTDQDNAIVYSGNGEEDIEVYYRNFAEKVNRALSMCGFPLCRGNVMAMNSKFAGSLRTWTARIKRWVTSKGMNERELLDANVFLDFRVIEGDSLLGKKLRKEVAQAMKANNPFMRSLVQTVVDVPLPLGFFRNYVVEESGKYRKAINLKTYGLVPLTTCIKALCLAGDVEEMNTLERLLALKNIGVLTLDHAEALEQAFETLLTLKIRSNLRDIDEGRGINQQIDLAVLTTRQKRLLRDAFLSVAELQRLTRQYFGITK